MCIVYCRDPQNVGYPAAGRPAGRPLTGDLRRHRPATSTVNSFRLFRQCLKWSKKEAGSLPQAEVECPLPRIFYLFIFDLKMASFDAFLVVFYAI